MAFLMVFPVQNISPLAAMAHGQAHHRRLQGTAAQGRHRSGGQDLAADDAIDLATGVKPWGKHGEIVGNPWEIPGKYLDK